MFLFGTFRYQCLQEVTFYVASNNGSVLLSCAAMLALGLIQPCTRLDYLPPRASLITSSADHPKKTKFHVGAHVSRKESKVTTVSNQQGTVYKLITSKDQILQCYTQANPLPTSASTSKRSFEARN